MEITTAAVAEIVKRIVAEMEGAPAKSSGEIPVGISNRHSHLSKEDMETLFGKGYELTPLKDLSQPGQYACKETLTLVGPSMRAIEGVRVLGPLRKCSQVKGQAPCARIGQDRRLGARDHHRSQGYRISEGGLHHRKPSHPHEP